MYRTDDIPGTARPMRTKAVRGVALALALATGAGGTAALLSDAGPVSAQTNVTETTAAETQVITPTTFSVLAEKVTPAVVAIRSEGASGGPGAEGRKLPPDHPLNEFMERFFGDQEGFEEFERRFGERGEGSDNRPRLAQGSGFVISPEGHIVTNEHVIEGAGSITVVTTDDREFEAEVVGTDPRTDLAVLKIVADTDLPYVEFSDIEAKVGDWVAAVGNPFGLGGTVTTGIVSARGRHIGSGPYDEFLQIDAAVNRGNSGGPTFNLDGEVVGVNTAIYSPNGGSVGIGFAIPASIVSDVVTQLIDNGEITRGWLGVSIQTVTPDIARSVGLDNPSGAIVAEVFPDSPAAAAGLEPGDVVIDVDGRQIETSRDLARVIADMTPGNESSLTIHRNRSEQTVAIDIGTMPRDPRLAGLEESEEPDQQDEQQTAEDTTIEDHLAELGLQVEPAAHVDEDPDARGVVVTDVLGGSEADEEGISRGDRILRVGGVAVNTPSELSDALNEARADGLDSVLVLLRSGSGQHFVTLELTRA